MWRLSKIEIENIVSFKEATLEVKQGVATLIFGRNEDNAAQPCNGSGKSSLIEAISFALTGEQLRKVKSVEEIINDQSDYAWVRITLENDYDSTVFMVERTIKRGAAQVIECHKYDSSGNQVDADKTVQPTVADYNKFILSEIGLSKEDIYNNYILCDNKYESFFDCSDRNKKEVINRFSNGIIIDESIERLQADLQPISDKLDAAKSKVIEINGSISAIESELAQADVKKADAEAERENRLRELEKKILECRERIETCKANKAKGEARMNDLATVENAFTLMENSDNDLSDCYRQAVKLCGDYSLGEITDFEALLRQDKRQLADMNADIKLLSSKMEEQRVAMDNAKAGLAKVQEAFQSHAESVKKADDVSYERKKVLIGEIDKLDAQLNRIDDKIKKNTDELAKLNKESVRIETLLSGVITCPKCKHQFVLDHDENVDEFKENLDELKLKADKIKKDNDKLDKQSCSLDNEVADKEDAIKAIGEDIKKRASELETEYSQVRTSSKRVDAMEDEMSTFKRRLAALQYNIDKMNSKIEILRQRLFGEVTGIIGGKKASGEQYISQQEQSIMFAEGQMRQYRASKVELKNSPLIDFEGALKKSLEKYQENLKEAQSEMGEIQARYDELKGQEVNFTMFKSYIARKKINALSLIVNDFLEKIGSDIRLKLEGFTVTKTGKLRDKISVQVMRDGVDCGSYHKFSGGEKARLNLACILSLHTLTNSNCEEGKGLDFIIIDELLDKSDEVGMSTYCEALNRLGQTALLITQGGVSEGYPYKLLITKRQGVSTITK